MNIEYNFKAAGHGTFFHSVITQNYDTLNWVYDCGSKKTSQLTSIINNSSLSNIDLLVLSHFDQDHINGLGELLSKAKVNILALPYMSLEYRLAYACSMVSEESISKHMAFFCLDPISYLREKNLLDNICEIALIKGGSKLNKQDEHFVIDNDYNYDFNNPEYENNTTDATKSEILIYNLSHGEKYKFRKFDWEFIFFNKNEQKSKIKKNKTLDDLKKDIRNQLKLDGFYNKERKIKKNWADNLRKIYISYFGANAKEKNEISLCLMASAFDTYSKKINEVQLNKISHKGEYIQNFCIDAYEEFISLSYNKDKLCREVYHTIEHDNLNYNFPNSGSIVKNTMFYSTPTRILLTGDISLTEKNRNELISHFGSSKVKDLFLMQIPHHGSSKCWQEGNHKYFNSLFHVVCVPDVSNHHPSAKVMDDLKNSYVIKSNYENTYSFVINY